MRDYLAGHLFDSRVRSEKVGRKEKYLGYFLGPISVVLMNSILSNYLNVYYTDVLKISGIWGGLFIGAFPIVAKILDVLTFIYMGRVVDRTRSKQGKARPWIFLSAPLLVGSMVLLFVVPVGNENLTALWIFVSYTTFYGFLCHGRTGACLSDCFHTVAFFSKTIRLFQKNKMKSVKRAGGFFYAD